MPRPRGRRNVDYAESREELVRRLRARLAAPDGPALSFRELAAAAGVGVTTLRHYFGDRDGAVIAVMQHMHALGLEHLRFIAAGPLGPLGPTLRAVLEYTVRGFAHAGLGRLMALGMAAGPVDNALGPAYVAEILEPTLQAIETRLHRHREAGDLRTADLRYAALSLLAPPLLALLHQHELGGEDYRRLDTAAFLDAHVAGFVAAYATREDPGAAPPAPSPAGPAPRRRAPRRAPEPAGTAPTKPPANAAGAKRPSGGRARRR